jgi:hypothetical protein
MAGIEDWPLSGTWRRTVEMSRRMGGLRGGPMDNKSRTQGLKSYFPIIFWLPHYSAEWLRFDIVAALSVCCFVPRA